MGPSLSRSVNHTIHIWVRETPEKIEKVVPKRIQEKKELKEDTEFLYQEQHRECRDCIERGC